MCASYDYVHFQNHLPLMLDSQYQLNDVKSQKANPIKLNLHQNFYRGEPQQSNDEADVELVR